MDKSDINLFQDLSEKFSLIPLKGKDPSINGQGWQKWCVEKRTFKTNDFKNRNAGICTGPASGVNAFDKDDVNACNVLCKANNFDLPETFTVTTGNGEHLYYQYSDDGREYGCKSLKHPVFKKHTIFDIKGIGGQVVAPGSIHPETGKPYTISKDVPIAPAPQWLLDYIHGKSINTDCLKSVPPSKFKAEYIEKMPVNKITQKNILTTFSTGDRSEIQWGVLKDLLSKSIHENLIFYIFDNYPIGEKYREKGSGKHKWLSDEIQRAKDHNHTSQGAYENINDNYEPSIKQWPKLDNAALLGIADRFVELATKNSEADPAAVLVTFLSWFGVELGRNPFFRVGDSKHHANIYSVVVGETSKARKGTSAQPINRLNSYLIRNYFDEEPTENTDSLVNSLNSYTSAKTSPGPLSTGEGLIYAVRDPVTTWQINKKTNIWEWVETDPGEQDKRLFILDEELAAAFRCIQRDGNTLSTTLRALWDSGKAEPLTKTNRIKTTDAHVGIVSHITIEELAKRLDEVEIFNGFANRFLWICSKRQKLVPFPEPIPEHDLIEISKDLRRLIEGYRNPVEIQFAIDARDLWVDKYPKLSSSFPGIVGSVLNRAEAQVIRLSMLYCCLEGSHYIGANHLEAALALWKYSKQSAFYIFDTERSPTVETIIEALKTGPKTATELYKLFKNNMSKSKMDRALNVLISGDRIHHKEDKSGAGRPKKIFYLNEKNELNELNINSDSYKTKKVRINYELSQDSSEIIPEDQEFYEKETVAI